METSERRSDIIKHPVLCNAGSLETVDSSLRGGLASGQKADVRQLGREIRYGFTAQCFR